MPYRGNLLSKETPARPLLPPPASSLPRALLEVARLPISRPPFFAPSEADGGRPHQRFYRENAQLSASLSSPRCPPKQLQKFPVSFNRRKSESFLGWDENVAKHIVKLTHKHIGLVFLFVCLFVCKQTCRKTYRETYRDSHNNQ
jgi:hypothetical protein